MTPYFINTQRACARGERFIVVLSACHALILEITYDTVDFRYELTQNDDLGPFIVLLFKISG